MFIHYVHVDTHFPLTKTIPIMFERVTTHYWTLQTWIGYNVTHYHNFSALPHALPYNFSQSSIVWDICNALPRVTVKFIKKCILIFFLKKKLMVTRCNPFKMIPEHIPDGHFPDRYFPEQAHPRWTLPRLDISPMDISPTRQMPDRYLPD